MFSLFVFFMSKFVSRDQINPALLFRQKLAFWKQQPDIITYIYWPINYKGCPAALCSRPSDIYTFFIASKDDF